MAKTASSIKPYHIRSVHEWCTDNGFTPYIVVFVKGEMQVPMDYVKNNEIVLNTSYSACRNLQMNNDFITFSGRFNGKSEDLVIPVGAVISIFARENGEGMGFNYDETVGEPGDLTLYGPGVKEVCEDILDTIKSNNATQSGRPRPSGPPKLTIVK